MKKNVAGQKVGIQMCSATDGSAFTGAVTVFVTGDAGTQSQGTVGSGACTHEGNGFHTYAPSQAETNFDHIAFTFTGTGAVPSTLQVFPTFPQTGDSFARLGAPAGASIAADVAGVQSDTDNIQTRIPAALVSGRMDSSIGAVASGVIAAASFAANALDAVWSTAARLLTAGTNIVLAKGTGVTGFNDLSAAQVNTEADTALSDVGLTTTITGRVDAAVSTRLATAGYTAPDNAGIATINAAVDTEVAAIKAKTDNLPSSPAAVGSAMTLTSGERDSISAALLDLAAGVETSLTLRQALRLLVAAEAGKLSGAATTTIVIRNVADSKNRITATVDASGNRSAVVYDLT
jgi:hypothetical protein